MKITSTAFENNKDIPVKYTCEGENINPPFTISGVLGEVKSLALIVDDPDARRGIFTHWVMWNIDPITTEIFENSVPIGATEGLTDFGKSGYGGPCPTIGKHRYFFKIFALDTILSLNASSVVADIVNAMNGHIVDQAEIIGLYKKIK